LELYCSSGRGSLGITEFIVQKAYLSTMQLQRIWLWIASDLRRNQTFSFHARGEKILHDYELQASYICVRIKTGFYARRLDSAANYYFF